jgi:hypothetical protein
MMMAFIEPLPFKISLVIYSQSNGPHDPAALPHHIVKAGYRQCGRGVRLHLRLWSLERYAEGHFKLSLAGVASGVDGGVAVGGGVEVGDVGVVEAGKLGRVEEVVDLSAELTVEALDDGDCLDDRDREGVGSGQVEGVASDGAWASVVTAGVERSLLEGGGVEVLDGTAYFAFADVRRRAGVVGAVVGAIGGGVGEAEGRSGAKLDEGIDLEAADNGIDDPSGVIQEVLAGTKGQLGEGREVEALTLVVVGVAVVVLDLRPGGGDEKVASATLSTEWSGGVIERVREGVGGGELDAGLEAAVEPNLQTVVVARAVVDVFSHAEALRREELGSGDELFAAVVDDIMQVGGVGADVGDIERGIGAELLGELQVVLLNL